MQKDEEVALHREKYAGSQAERSLKAAADAEASKVANKLKGTKLSGNNLSSYLFFFLARIIRGKSFFVANLEINRKKLYDLSVFHSRLQPFSLMCFESGVLCQAVFKFQQVIG